MINSKVGFIGLGNMGGSMALKLYQAGFQTTVCDVRVEAIKFLNGMYSKVVDSPVKVGEECNIVVLSLPDSDVVEKVVLGENGLIHGIKAGSTIVDMTSGFPPKTMGIYDKIKKINVEMLDAPVSGGPHGLEAGTLSIMVGGSEEEFKKVYSIFLALAKEENIYHVGDLGSGHSLKAINNFLNATHRWISNEAVSMAVKFGMDVEKVVDVLSLGGGRNYSINQTFPKFVLRNREAQGFSLGLMHKDVKIVTDLGKTYDVPLLLAQSLKTLLKMLQSIEGVDQDINYVSNFFENICHISLMAEEGAN